MNTNNETAMVTGGSSEPKSGSVVHEDVPGSRIVLKHSHSVPVKNRKEAMNPLLFRNSRSNIYDGAEGEEEDEQRQCVDTGTIIISDSKSNSSGSGSGIKVKRMSIKNKLNSHLHLKNSQTWTIDNNQVDEISPLFQTQLQRTHAIIDEGESNGNGDEDEMSPSTVAMKISNYLNSISASTLYDDENAIAHAELEDDLRILIRLYRKTTTMNTTNTKKRQIVVEVTRRNGCSAQYHATAMKILSAARGNSECKDTVDYAESESKSKSESSTLSSGASVAGSSTSVRRSSLARAREVKVPAELKNEFLKQVKIV